MGTSDRNIFYRINIKLMFLLVIFGFAGYYFLWNNFLIGIIYGGLFCGVNFFLLVSGVSMFFYPTTNKYFAYFIVALKSLIIYGGLAFLLFKIKINPLGFLSGFGGYTLLLVFISMFSVRRLKNA